MHSYSVIYWWCLGRKAKPSVKAGGHQGRSTQPFIAPYRSTGPAPGTGSPGNRNINRRSPIVRAQPFNNNQQGSPTGGFGDLGGSPVGIDTTISMRPEPIGPDMTTRSQPSSALFVSNRNPVAGAVNPVPPRPQSRSSTSSSHAPSPVNGGPASDYRFNVAVRSSLV